MAPSTRRRRVARTPAAGAFFHHEAGNEGASGPRDFQIHAGKEVHVAYAAPHGDVRVPLRRILPLEVRELRGESTKGFHPGKGPSSGKGETERHTGAPLRLVRSERDAHFPGAMPRVGVLRRKMSPRGAPLLQDRHPESARGNPERSSRDGDLIASLRVKLPHVFNHRQGCPRGASAPGNPQHCGHKNHREHALQHGSHALSLLISWKAS